MRTASFGTLVAAAAILGCGSREREQPAFSELYPAKGVVKRDGVPVKGGSVQFFPDPDTNEFLTNSPVGDDGTFDLSTVRTTDRTGERRPGAPAGKYKANYIPPLGDQLSGGQGNPISIPGPITIEAKENELELKLPK